MINLPLVFGINDTMHSLGGVATSDTERFAGYHRTLGSQNGEEVIHTWHWAKSSNDERSPLVKQDLPQDILDAFEIKAKGSKLK